MEQIESVDRVICICTPNYVEKANNPSGGVGYERMIVTAALLKSLSTTKFVPVIRSGPGTPTFLSSRLYIDFRSDAAYLDSLDKLLRELHQVPHPGKPPIGKSPFDTVPLPPGEPKAAAKLGARKPTEHPKYRHELEGFR